MMPGFTTRAPGSRHAALGLVAGLLSMTPSPAWAISVSRSFCGEYAVDYDDANSTIHDDDFTDLTDKPARGARIRVLRNSDLGVIFDTFTTTGADENCTTSMTLDTAQSYTVRLYSVASIDGDNTVTVRDASTDNLIYDTLWSAYTPTLHGALTVTASTGLSAVWDIAAAAGWAIHKHPGGITGESFLFHSNPSSNKNKFYQNGGDPYIEVSHNTSKYIIVHELGHWMEFAGNGHTLGTVSEDYSEPGLTCPSGGTPTTHKLNSSEYQKAAFIEGYASFYAQVAFNDLADSDCYYWRNGVDWNLNGSSTDDTNQPGCDGGPYAWPLSGSIDSHDYFGDMCLGSGGASVGRGTQYDWMRFFWDLTSDEGLTYLNTMQIMDLADPEAWVKNPGDTGTDPPTELLSAATTLGFSTAWTNQDHINGVDR